MSLPYSVSNRPGHRSVLSARGRKGDARGTLRLEPLESRALFAVNPVAPEFLVHGTTAGTQDPAAVAVDAAGNFVVVWQSSSGDGDSDVYARRFSATGTPVGGEFLVHSGTAGVQTAPAVAMADDGGFVVAWENDALGDGNTNVYARRFGATGAAFGGEFLVNTTTDGAQSAPAVSADADGDFVVVWHGPGQDGTGPDVYARRFDNLGNPAGDEFVVNTLTDGDQSAADVALDGDGDFVVVWHHSIPAPDITRFEGDVYARRFSAAGVAAGPEFVVNTTTPLAQRSPAVSAAPGGDFVVAWQGFTTPENHFDIYAQRFNAAGAPQGGEIAVNETGAGRQTTPLVAVGDDGGFLVGWLYGTSEVPRSFSVQARQYGNDGTPVGASFPVNTAPAPFLSAPALGGTGSGEFVFVWSNLGEFSDPDVFARVLAEPDPDPLPAFSIGDVTVAEGDAGNAVATFTVTLTGPGAGSAAASVAFATADGTALAGADYEATSGVLEFAAGETSKTVSVTVLGERLREGDETFLLNLSNPTGATVADAQAVATVTDDDPVPAVSVADATASEAGPLVFTVTLSNPTTETVTVQYATAGGTATAGADYTAATGVVTFEPGQTSRTVTVAVADDALDEVDETFTLDLSNPSGASVADEQATATLTDNDAPPAVFIDDTSVTEGDAGKPNVPANFTVRLSAPSGRLVRIVYSFAAISGTAERDADYKANSAILEFQPGETTKTITANVIGDALDENDETFTVVLSAAGNTYVLGDDGIATAVILDNDPAPSLTITDATVVEGDDAAGKLVDVTVELSDVSGRTVSVNYATADGTAAAPGDYEPGSGTLVFQPGERTKVVRVRVVGDTADEEVETVLVNLSDEQNATIADGQGVVSIGNDDVPHVQVLSPASAIPENAGPAAFIVRLDRPGVRPVTVDFTTVAGEAVAGADFTAAGGTLTFAPGETEKTIQVGLTDDALDESDESFSVQLSNVTHGVLDGLSATASIADDDPPPALSVDDVHVTETSEGTLTATFTVTLSAASGLPVTVDFTTQDGTATAGADYDATTGTLTFAPGETSKSVVVRVLDDNVFEPFDETFRVQLANATNATIADESGTGTIADDEAPPVVSVGDVTVAEGAAGATTPATFTLTLSRPSAVPLTVNYSTADGTATHAGAAADYAAVTDGSVTFAPGETTKTLTVTVNGDDAVEPDETFRVDLAVPAGAVLERDHAIGTITNDDAPPSERLTVTAVYVGSSAWTDIFKAYLAEQGLGSARYGFAITAADQLNELPWSNLDQFTVVFNRPAVVQQDDLVVRGANVAQYLVTAFTYNGPENTATWTLDRAVRNDRLLLDLDGDSPGAVHDWAGGTAEPLDGEWAAGGTDTFPSGDGTAGGDFRFRVNVLPGDVDRSGGRVNSVDLLQVRRRQGASTASAPGASSSRGYSVFCDVNGNGAVSPVDMALVRSRLQTRLPAGEPTVPTSPATASITRDLFSVRAILA